MAGIMDMIGSREQSTDKVIAEATVQCLKEMKKQSTENVELVKSINSLVEAGITKIKGMEADNGNTALNEETVSLINQKFDELKTEITDEINTQMQQMTQQLNEKIEKENNKCYKNMESILDEHIEQQEKANKSNSRWLKLIVWFLFLTNALIIANILGVF